MRLATLNPGGENRVGRPEASFPLENQQVRTLWLGENGRMTDLPSETEGSVSYCADDEVSVTSFAYAFDEETEITGYMWLHLNVASEKTDDMDIFVNVRKLTAEGEEVPVSICDGEPHPGAWGALRVSHRALDEKLTTKFNPVQSHAAEEKNKGLAGSAFGIVGLETAFPLLYTELVKKGVLHLEQLVGLLTEKPRARFRIPLGNDFSVWDLDAEYEIKKAKVEGRELSAEEKANYAKAMVKRDIAVRRLSADSEKEAPEAEEKVAILGMAAKPVNKLDRAVWDKNPNKRPSPGNGKIWMDTMQHCIGSLYKVYRPLPESLGQLSAQKGLETLDKIAEQVVKQENMAQKPTQWLADEIDKPTIDMTKSMADAIQKVANPNAPVKNGPAQPAVQKANEAAPKKNEGPQGPVA